MSIHRLTTDTPSPCGTTGCTEGAVWATRAGKACDTHVHPAHRRIAVAAERESRTAAEPTVADRAMIAIDWAAAQAHAGMVTA